MTYEEFDRIVDAISRLDTIAAHVRGNQIVMEEIRQARACLWPLVADVFEVRRRHIRELLADHLVPHDAQFQHLGLAAHGPSNRSCRASRRPRTLPRERWSLLTAEHFVCTKFVGVR